MGATHQPRSQTSRLIAIIDDNESMQDSLRDLIESAGLVARCFGSAEEFLESARENSISGHAVLVSPTPDVLPASLVQRLLPGARIETVSGASSTTMMRAIGAPETTSFKSS